MKIKEERRGSVVILRLEGAFGETVPALEEALRRGVEDNSVDVIVDLSATTDFKPARTLVGGEKLRRDLGGTRRFAVVAEPDSDIRIALALSGFSKIAPIFGSVDDVLFAWETDGMPI